MSCPNDATLWSYADGALDAAERAGIEDHLSGCAACQGSLTAVKTTRRMLGAVAGSSVAPPIDWKRADDAVMTAATERFARSARWRMPAFAFGGALVAASLALVLWAPWKTSPVVDDRGAMAAKKSPASADEGPLAGVVLESVGSGSTVRAGGSGSEVALRAGAGVTRGSTLATREGSIVVRLPEESRARMAPKTQATILRASRDEIALRVDSGALTVKAAHSPRKEFVVETDAAQVRVVGTAFRVQREPTQTIVSVAEGRVEIEPRAGDSRLVDAGHRVVLSNTGAWIEDAAFREDEASDFDALGVVRARSTALAAEGPGEGGHAKAHPHVTSTKSGEPQNTPPIASLTPEIAPTSPSPSIAPTPQTAAPSQKDAEATAAAKANGVPTTAEGLFLQRAHDGLKSGRCESFQLGLQDIVESSEDKSARETAQILRARCYDEQLKPEQATTEYKKYLQKFPTGRFTDEARRAIGD